MTIKEKILMVDDEPELLKSTGALLEAVGYEVSIADGGKRALTLLNERDFDLVLLDLNMPDIDGHDVMDFIHQENIGVSVVVISGESGFHWVSRAFRLGAYDYIQKPYEFEALHNAIKNALRKRELEKTFSRLRKQLERSERLHRFMIESSPDIIFIIDSNGCFAFANDRAEDLLGYKKDELLGEHFSTIVDPEYMDKATHCFSERRAGSRAKKAEKLWLKCKPGLHTADEKNRIAIELNAVGVYEDDDPGNQEQRPLDRYSGTYIVARDITERLESERLIHFQAYHDLLTGLPNRALFSDRLENAISNSRREGNQLAIMFLDLDRFKVVNDSLGHSVGDKLLKQLAERLKASLREGDTLARLGGDEFIVLLPKVQTEDVAHLVGRKIIKTVQEPFNVDGHELFITASVGISIFPRDGEDVDTLIKNSDAAMYHTKDQGRNNYHFYVGDMSVKNDRLLIVENEIRRGIKESQFEVFYQPQINARTGAVSGVEALLRWNHPERGLLSPAFFLSVAEESGLIIELGEWVLRTAIAEVKCWRDSGIIIEKLAVNFSSREIEQANFVDKIVNALEHYDFPGTSLEVELTESILMSEIESTIPKLKKLREFGVNIAIDDFGTGYSSLSLLQKLPINRLKIDRSFIQEMQQGSDRSIIEAIAHMAKGLRLEMVAEGVEQDYQLNYLRKLDCPVVQGFFFSQGVPGDEAKKFVSDIARLLEEAVTPSNA